MKPLAATSAPSALQTAYEARLASGDLRPDAAQTEAIKTLQQLVEQLDGYQPPQGLLSSLGLSKSKALTTSGLYLYGDVGRGKSMLMDFFFAHANVAKKRRVHFHHFMLEIHARLHHLQQFQLDDLMPGLAEDLAKETWLLCFDEFHVNNIADAMILGRLFEALFNAGVVIVATSNWAPDDLYKNGLQRERFVPFIDLIKQKMIVHKLAGAVDHRYEQIRGMQSYFYPLGDEATRKLQGIFLQLTNDAEPESIELPVQGRTLKIVHAAQGVGYFNFEELCVLPLGAGDYLAIAECLHTVLLDGVPQLTPELRNETLRFMTFIDTLYENKVKFFMAAAASPEKLSPSGEHNFAFQRTLSRLMEMQSDDYRQKPHLG